MRLSLGDAPPLLDGGGHDLGRIHPFAPEVTLHTRDLEARLREGEWALGDPSALATAARVLLQRVAIHELTHLVDRRQHLSASAAWRDLAGWRWWSRGLTPYTPLSFGEFAAPWGAKSPAEDLATFAEIYFVPPPLGPFDAEASPRCRFPAKYRFLRDRLGAHPEPTPHVVCSGPADVGLADVGEIHILLAAPTLDEAATMGGHLLLAVELGHGRWDTFALTADAGPMGTRGLDTVLLGLIGGFRGRIERHPYETTRLRYVEGQNRDLLRFRWKLAPEEKARLLARLDDIALHWRRPYLFLQQNCSALIVELASAAEGERFPSPFVAAPDIVLSELARRGRLEPVPPDPEHDLAPVTRARLLAGDVAAAADAACGGASRSDWAALAERATEDCWADLARLLALSAPLAAVGGSDADREAVLAEARERVPVEARAAFHAEADALAGAEWERRRARGEAALHSPWSPVTLGTMVDGVGEESPVAMVYTRRAVIDLVHGQPRVFAPADGVDLRVLDTRVAASLDADLLARLELVAFAYHSRPVLPRPAPMLRLGALSTEVSTRKDAAWARWANAEAGLTLHEGPAGRTWLDASIGLDARSALDVESGDLGTWVAAPVTMRGAAHSNGSAALGLDGNVALLPAFGTGGRALSVVAEASAWVYLGKIGRTGVKLALGGRAPWRVEGEVEHPPASAEVGLRLERR